MTPLERRGFQRRAQRDEYQRRVERAAGWIHDLFDRFDAPVVNFSGGKDSLVLLYLVADRCGYDDVNVYHFDNGLLNVPGATDFAAEAIERIGGHPLIRTSQAANSEQMVTEEGHGYRGFWGHHRQLWEDRGWDCRLLGIRAQESSRRRDRFDSDRGTLPLRTDVEFPAAAPIHQLAARDVWACIVANDLDYHPIYDEQGDLFDGMAHPRNRLVTLYDSEFDSLGSLEVSQWLYPTETNELKAIEQDTE